MIEPLISRWALVIILLLFTNSTSLKKISRSTMRNHALQ